MFQNLQVPFWGCIALFVCPFSDQPKDYSVGIIHHLTLLVTHGLDYIPSSQMQNMHKQSPFLQVKSYWRLKSHKISPLLVKNIHVFFTMARLLKTPMNSCYVRPPSDVNVGL
jgi:hypothetical protein